MKISFIGQPLDSNGGSLASHIENLLSDESYSELRAVVAWMKRSGLRELESAISTFRLRAKAEAFVGIDEGGATKQGLELALAVFDSVYVVHDPGPPKRTFHPKVYLFEGSERAAVIIGSNNATLGGLFSNYEACLLLDLDLSQEEDCRVLAEVAAWIEMLQSDTEVCLPLDQALLRRLVQDPRYRIGDEDERSSRRNREQEYDGVTEDDGSEGLFGRSQTSKAPLPARQAPSRFGQRGGTTPSSSGGTAVVSVPATATHRWWKRLTASDAQHPPTAGSAETGNLRLAKAGRPIDHKTYFRTDMFGTATWRQSRRPRGTMESSTVHFDVVIDGHPHGSHALNLDHATFRIANQNNVPTVLHWGPFAQTLRNRDLTGEWILLERFTDGRYRLEITPTEPR